MSSPTIRPTRYPELGYSCHGPGLWRIVDSETGSPIGPQYRTKAELLADLGRYAKEYGSVECEERKSEPCARYHEEKGK